MITRKPRPRKEQWAVATMVPVMPLFIISPIQLQLPIAYYKAMLKDHIEREKNPYYDAEKEENGEVC